MGRHSQAGGRRDEQRVERCTHLESLQLGMRHRRRLAPPLVLCLPLLQRPRQLAVPPVPLQRQLPDVASPQLLLHPLRQRVAGDGRRPRRKLCCVERRRHGGRRQPARQPRQRRRQQQRPVASGTRVGGRSEGGASCRQQAPGSGGGGSGGKWRRCRALQLVSSHCVQLIAACTVCEQAAGGPPALKFHRYGCMEPAGDSRAHIPMHTTLWNVATRSACTQGARSRRKWDLLPPVPGSPKALALPQSPLSWSCGGP